MLVSPKTFLLLESLAEELIKKKEMLVTAESCTGGLLSAYITDIAGSSRWYWGGFITYSNESKNALGVEKKTISTYGAVSKQVVTELVTQAVVRVEKKAVGVAISGIAGPNGGTETKPVGTVSIGWKISDQIITKTLLFSGNRQQIRKLAADYAIKHLCRLHNL